MKDHIPTKRLRDIAIQAAVDRIIIALHPGISTGEIQERGSMLIWPDMYVVQFDGIPLIRIMLYGKRSFKLTVL